MTGLPPGSPPLDVAFPLHWDDRGRTAQPVSADRHVHELLEQLLFTSPGERVNRPDVGSGLLQLVFAPNSGELAATVQYTTQAAIQRWLGDVVELDDLAVRADGGTLQVDVAYTVRRTGEQAVATFSREVGT